MRIIEIEGSVNKENLYRDFEMYLQYLDFEVKNLSGKKGFSIIIELEEIYDNEVFYDYLAKAIEDIIISNYMDKIIKKRVDRIYPGQYSDIDKILLDRIKHEIRTSNLHIDDKIRAREELIDYLKENNNIFLDGYIMFRLTDYLYILDIAIDSIMTEYEEELRIDEFIEMIKYFMDIQSSKIELLNVIITRNNFILKDAEGQEVGQEIIEEVYRQFEDIEGSKSDILLSSLITMAPNKLKVHFAGNKDVLLIRAILKIFGDRVSFCDGCKICGLDQEERK